MESRKTVLMNLFSEHSDIENRLMDTEVGEGRREWDEWRE